MSKLVGGFLVLCVALAVLRMAVVALVVALLLALLVSFVTRPRETLTFVGTLVLMGVAHARPIAFAAILGIIFLAVVVVGRRRRRSTQLLLTDGRRDNPPEPEQLDRDVLG